MSINALTEVAWIPTARGLLSPRDTLAAACDIPWPPPDKCGYEVSALTRFLAEFMAVAMQESGWRSGAVTAISPQALDQAVARIGASADVFDPVQPFLQRPALPGKTTATTINPVNAPIKKLSPAMPPNQAEDFWERSSAWPTSLPMNEALLALAVFHYFSPAGNNAYDGDKCQMGAPGLRFPGKDYTATEFVWRGDSLLETLSYMIPNTWVTDGGLPAWADRDGNRSISGIHIPSLWAASWSSNAAACQWDGSDLIATRVGGVPPNWIPAVIGKDSKQQKEWWNQRNQSDPFYFYSTNRQNERKMVRIDIGRTETDLVAEWHSRNLGDELIKTNTQRRVLAADYGTPLIMLRHLVGGTGSSPSIRRSEVMTPNTGSWLPQGSRALAVKTASTALRDLHGIVTRPFRRKTYGDSQIEASGRGAVVLDALEQQRRDMSETFWRNLSEVFDEVVTQASANVTNTTWKKAGSLTMKAFDEVVAPSSSQLGPRLLFVRAWVEAEVWKLMRTYIDEEEE